MSQDLRFYELAGPTEHTHPQHRIVLVEGPAEKLAMAQAMHSRAVGSVVELFGDANRPLEVPDAAMRAKIDKWVIGYNHVSILNGSHVVLFLENIPLYLAQVLQAHPLYRGTEKSSRFVDMAATGSRCGCCVEDNARALAEASARWFAGSLPPKAQGDYVSLLASIYRSYSNERQRIADLLAGRGMDVKAANVRACDLTRSLLPLATPTSLSLSVDLETLSSMLATLRHAGEASGKHSVYQTLHDQLARAVAAFSPTTVAAAKTAAIQDVPLFSCAGSTPEPEVKGAAFDRDSTAPDYLRVRLNLDYGSARDLYRHRTVSRKLVVQLLELSPRYRAEIARDPVLAGTPAAEQFARAETNYLLNRDLFLSQYGLDQTGAAGVAAQVSVTSLGARCRVELAGPADKVRAVLERRSRPDAHFTLCQAIGEVADRLELFLPGNAVAANLALETDWQRRARADITDAQGNSLRAAATATKA